jgi:hypothetical protein
VGATDSNCWLPQMVYGMQILSDVAVGGPTVYSVASHSEMGSQTRSEVFVGATASYSVAVSGH